MNENEWINEKLTAVQCSIIIAIVNDYVENDRALSIYKISKRNRKRSLTIMEKRDLIWIENGRLYVTQKGLILTKKEQIKYYATQINFPHCEALSLMEVE